MSTTFSLADQTRLRCKVLRKEDISTERPGTFRARRYHKYSILIRWRHGKKYVDQRFIFEGSLDGYADRDLMAFALNQIVNNMESLRKVSIPDRRGIKARPQNAFGTFGRYRRARDLDEAMSRLLTEEQWKSAMVMVSGYHENSSVVRGLCHHALKRGEHEVQRHPARARVRRPARRRSPVGQAG